MKKKESSVGKKADQEKTGFFAFSEKELQKLYRAARRLLFEERFSEAQCGFFFLTAIAPNISEFWLGLAFSSVEIGDFTLGKRAACVACMLDPKSPDTYLARARTCMEMQDFDAALAVIEEALCFAKETEEPWGDALTASMVQAKKRIQELFEEVEYSSISS